MAPKNEISAKRSLKFYLNSFLSRFFGLFILGLALALTAIGVFYFLIPKYRAVLQGVEAANKEKEAESLELEKKTEKLIVFARDYGKINSADKERLDIMLPDNDEYDELFALLEKITETSGALSVKSLSITPDNKQGGTANPNLKARLEAEEDTALPAGVGRIDIEMEVAGVDYRANLNRLLDNLETNLKLMDIASMDFDPENGTAKLKIKTYYLKEGDGSAMADEENLLDQAVFSDPRYRQLREGDFREFGLTDLEIGKEDPFSPEIHE